MLDNGAEQLVLKLEQVFQGKGIFCVGIILVHI